MLKWNTHVILVTLKPGSPTREKINFIRQSVEVCNLNNDDLLSELYFSLVLFILHYSSEL